MISTLDDYFLDRRMIFINGHIEPEVAADVVKQLLYLDWQNPNQDITMIINSPGGNVISGLSIIDTMDFIKPDISVISLGQSASMASVILSNGTKSKRGALPNSEIMIHSVSAGNPYGHVADIEIQTERIKELNNTLTDILARNCGKSFDFMYETMSRDTFLSANQALEMGLIDFIV